MSNSKRRSPTIVWRDAVRDSDLDGTAKAVAYTLSTYMNGKAEAFPSKATLAAGASLCDRAADRAILRLEATGFLRVERTRGRMSNRYYGAHPNPVPEYGVNPVRGDGVRDHQPRTNDTPTPYETTSNPVPSDPLSSSEIEKRSRRCPKCEDALDEDNYCHRCRHTVVERRPRKEGRNDAF